MVAAMTRPLPPLGAIVWLRSQSGPLRGVLKAHSASDVVVEMDSGWMRRLTRDAFWSACLMTDSTGLTARDREEFEEASRRA